MPPIEDLSVSSAIDALSDVPLTAPKAENPDDLEGPVDDDEDEAQDAAGDEEDPVDDDSSASGDEDDEGAEGPTNEVENNEDVDDKGEQDKLPAIDPPAALALDDKQREVFKQLPRAAQEFLIEHDKKLVADHTRKTQEVAEKRKHYEARLERLKDVKVERETRLDKWAKVDWVKLAQTMDTKEYNANRAQYEKELRESTAISKRVAEEEKAELERSDFENFKALKTLAPELADGDKGRQLRGDIINAVIKAGIPPQAARLISAQEMVFVHKALQWDKYQAEKSKKPTITETKLATTKGRSIAPASRTASGSAPRAAVQKNFVKNPSVANARRALENLPD